MKKFLFLILLIFICNCLFAQDTTKTKEKKNNAIKGIIAFEPFFFSGITSIGYERYITLNSSLNLTFNDFTYSAGDGGSSIANIILSYNYYFSSKYKVINNIWLGVYSLITKSYSAYENFGSETNGYGFGLYIGKRMYVTHKKRLFFDMGLGMSYNHSAYKYYNNVIETGTYNFVTMQYDMTYDTITSHKPENYFCPRPILLLGYKF